MAARQIKHLVYSGRLIAICYAAPKSTYYALQMPLLCSNYAYQESITGGASFLPMLPFGGA